jgi:NAD(P)-dependent dehydrogenase (short-subunit alcohol dehydrogenase family)
MVAFVTGADRGLGFGITKSLLERGYEVYAGSILDWHELPALANEYPVQLKIVAFDVTNQSQVRETIEQIPSLDLLVCNAGINRSAHLNTIFDGLDEEDILEEFKVNALGVLRTIQHALPCLEKGNSKRIAVVSSEAGSIGASYRTGWFGYCMSKAAVNMAVKNLHNDLSPKGFVFRLYHPGWIRSYMRGEKNLEAHLDPEEAGRLAVEYFLANSESLELGSFDGTVYPW